MVGGPAGVGKSTVSRLLAAGFERSVHLQIDDFMGSVVSGWVDPNLPEAAPQNVAVGAAFASAALSFASHGYTTILDGHFFPENAHGLAVAGAVRGVPCHYVVLTADLETCWARARRRVGGRWPLELAPFAALHARFAALGVPERCVDATTGSPESVRDEALRRLHSGGLAVRA